MTIETAFGTYTPEINPQIIIQLTQNHHCFLSKETVVVLAYNNHRLILFGWVLSHTDSLMVMCHFSCSIIQGSLNVPWHVLFQGEVCT
jgi:hypothetical protein